MAPRKIHGSKRRGDKEDEEKGPDDNARNDSAAKAMLKVEKLRRQLEKAEAKAQIAGKEPTTLQRKTVKVEPGDSTLPDVGAPLDRSSSASSYSSDLSTSNDPDDFTSSNDSSSADSDSDEAPDQGPITRRDPEDGTLSRRQHSRPACNMFKRTGRCKFGHGCKYSHDIPEDKNDSKAPRGGRQERPKRSTGRISLYQRVSCVPPHQIRSLIPDVSSWWIRKGKWKGERLWLLLPLRLKDDGTMATNICEHTIQTRCSRTRIAREVVLSLSRASRTA